MKNLAPVEKITYIPKVGDWVYSDFKLYQVFEIEGDIVRLANGIILTSFNTAAHPIFPLTIETKTKSEFVASQIQKIRNSEGGLNINWPRIIGAYSEYWIKLCSEIDTSKENVIYDKISQITRGLVNKIEHVKNIETEIGKLFRQ